MRGASLRGSGGSPPLRVQRTTRAAQGPAARSDVSMAGGAAAADASASMRRHPLARRRRLVGTLAVLVVGAVVGGQMSGLPGWAPAVPALGLVVYVLHVRREARRLREWRRRKHVADIRRLAARRRAEAAVAAAVERAARTEPKAVLPGTIHADGTWEPVRVPLPTYVTAPVVRRPPARVVSVDTEGLWTSGDLADLMSGFRGRPGVNAMTAFSSRRPASFSDGDTAEEPPAAQDGSAAARPRPRAVNE
jgi:hypothetical protein